MTTQTPKATRTPVIQTAPLRPPSNPTDAQVAVIERRTMAGSDRVDPNIAPQMVERFKKLINEKFSTPRQSRVDEQLGIIQAAIPTQRKTHRGLRMGNRLIRRAGRVQ